MASRESVACSEYFISKHILSFCAHELFESAPLSHPPLRLLYLLFAMSNKGRSTPRVVCCAIPVARAANKVLVITSRKRQQNWVVPKGGWEPKDVELAQAALREAWEEGPT